jgi:HSP20 family molecular chaperone IbpA
MYTTTLTNLDNLFENLFTGDLSDWKTTTYKTSTIDYHTKQLEDGKQELTLSVLGHNPKDIKLEVTEDKLTIKAKKDESASELVKDIDATFSVGKDYDANKTEAKFINGLLILTIDKKEERKAKSISIKVG